MSVKEGGRLPLLGTLSLGMEKKIDFRPIIIFLWTLPGRSAPKVVSKIYF